MEAKRSRKHDDDGVSLPEDIVFDVLARLPAKTLCRFRCVSKAWRALISDPVFVAAQRSRAGPLLVGVYFVNSICPQEVRVLDMDGNVVRVLELRLPGKDDGNDFMGGLQQQATTQLNVIVYRQQPFGATAMIIDPAAGRACAVDAYTPAPESHILSFGRATPSGIHKVLCVRIVEKIAGQQICTVATTMDGNAEPLRWRQRSTPPFVTSWYPQRRATVNGVVYFLPPPLGVYDAASSGLHRIAAFDLESEEWKMIHGPALGIQEYADSTLVTEHKGTLGFVQCLRDGNDVEYYYAIVWLLVDYNESVWVKDYTMQMPTTWELIKQIGVLDDGRVLLQVMSEWETNDNEFDYRDFLVFYNPSTRTFEEFTNKVRMGSTDILVLYTGSLLS